MATFKKLMILFIPLLLLISCSNKDDTAFFRETNWEMNREEVEEIEKDKTIVREFHGPEEVEMFYIEYDGKLGKYDSEVTYFFEKSSGKLRAGTYYKKDADPAEMNKAFDEIKKELVKKYGKETISKKDIKENPYGDGEQDIETYVWLDIDNTVIRLVFTIGITGRVNIDLSYMEKGYYEESNFKIQDATEGSGLSKDL